MHRWRAGEDRIQRLARSLGWFSVGLGMAEVVAPRAMARLVGIQQGARTASVVRALGAREIGHGFAILSRPERSGPLWARLAGDGMDLAILGSAFGSTGRNPRRAALAAATLLGVAVVDLLCAQRLSQSDAGPATTARRGVGVARSTTVNRPIEQAFAFWRNFENVPRFMRYVERVEALDERRSRWRAVGPAGVVFEWTAEITAESHPELIAWQSLPGSDIESRGTVRFQPAPGARGTEVSVELEYRAPAGSLGRTVAWLFGKDPEHQLTEDLRRFKQLLETGEIPLSEGPGLWRPAQPPAQPDQLKARAGVPS